MHFPPAVEVYLALAGLFIRHINQNDLLPELAFRAGIGGLGNLGLFRSWTEAKEYLQEIAEAVLALGEDREQKAPTDVIAAVGEFIAAHIHQDISLTQIADAVGLNPSYLSRLFKAETGGNISAAILNAKMDKPGLCCKAINIRFRISPTPWASIRPPIFLIFSARSPG